MIDSTPQPLLGDMAGGGSASPYGGGGRRAVMPETATNPAIGQSPASPYTAGFTEPLVRRAAPVRPVPSTPAPVEPVSLVSPVPAPSLAPTVTDEAARLEVPSPYEPSPYEPSPYEPSPTEPEPAESLELGESFSDESDPESSADPDVVDHETGAADLVADDPVEDNAVEPDALDDEAPPEEPVEVVAAPHPLASIPWIPRPPEPSLTEEMSAAQAYTAPVDPGMWFIGPMEESQAPPFVRVRHQGPERVRRGLLFAAIPLVLGCALSAALFHLGHIPSIVALAMAPAGALLYGKGAGSRPQAGAVKLVALLVVGVLLAWPVSLVTELFFYYKDTMGTSSGAIGYVVSNMFSASLFMAKLKELLLVALFGLGGVIAVLQTMIASRKRRRSEAS